MSELSIKTTPCCESMQVVLRPACMDDVDQLHELITVTSQSTTVLPRSRDSLCEHLRDFTVAESEGRIVGCGALRIYTKTLAEVRTLVVTEQLRGKGLGARLVARLVDDARRLGTHRIFALTDNEPFFLSQGFTPTDKDTLPQKVWTDCIHCPKYLCCPEKAVEMILGPVPGHDACEENPNGNV